MPKRKKTVRDRYIDPNLPSNNLDYVETPILSPEALDSYIYNSPQVQQVLGSSFQLGPIPVDPEKAQLRQKRLLKKVLAAASQVLTDRQFQVFLLRFVFGLTEEEIATRLVREYVGRPRLDKKKPKKAIVEKPVSQVYVHMTIERVVEKIQKALRLKLSHQGS